MSEQNEQNQHSGAHNAEPGEEVKSRSADPGQSSYGGFHNEDPSKQVQTDETEQADKKGQSITNTIAGNAK